MINLTRITGIMPRIGRCVSAGECVPVAGLKFLRTPTSRAAGKSTAPRWARLGSRTGARLQVLLHRGAPAPCTFRFRWRRFLPWRNTARTRTGTWIAGRLRANHAGR
jgi:hypothetical protein